MNIDNNLSNKINKNNKQKNIYIYVINILLRYLRSGLGCMGGEGYKWPPPPANPTISVKAVVDTAALYSSNW